MIHDRSDWPSFVDLVHHADRAYKCAPTFYDRDTGCEVRVEHLSDDLSVVAFRGTSDFHDAWMDARVAPWYDSQLGLGWVHRGFLLGVRSVWPRLQTAILGRRVVFTGHSKGGSEASLACGAACNVDGIYPVALVTFGAAKCVIGARVPKLLASRNVFNLRFEAAGDPVPNVPRGYSHVARNCAEVGEAWDSDADHPLMSSYLPGVAKWQATNGWNI